MNKLEELQRVHMQTVYNLNSQIQQLTMEVQTLKQQVGILQGVIGTVKNYLNRL